MTKLAHEYTIVRSETVIEEYVLVPAREAVEAVKDALPMPWRRIAVGAALGVAAGTAIGLHHTGFADGWILATEIMIASTGLALMGSLWACLLSIPSHR